MKNLLFFSSMVAVLLFAACDKRIGSAPKPPLVSATTAVSECDTITYTKHVKKIMDTYCGATPQCHVPASLSGGIDLDSYDQVKIYANNNKIKNTVFNSNPQQMPPDGQSQLSAAEKKLLTCWLGNGLKN